MATFFYTSSAFAFVGSAYWFLEWATRVAGMSSLSGGARLGNAVGLLSTPSAGSWFFAACVLLFMAKACYYMNQSSEQRKSDTDPQRSPHHDPEPLRRAPIERDDGQLHSHDRATRQRSL